MRTPMLLPPLRRLAVAAVLVALAPAGSWAQTVLFFEDFDGLPLGPSVDEPISFPDAFTQDPPPGWDRADLVPGIGDPQLGVTEWEGWSFANLDFWQAAAAGNGGPTLRDEFTLAQGTIAVADPDQWNDLGNPANTSDGGGFYNTIIQTPFIDLSSAQPDDIRLKVGFVTSWDGGDCCDDGRDFDGIDQPPPFSNNQTGFVRLRYSDNTFVELLRWESAPLLDAAGEPTNDPGPGTIPNPNYQPPLPNGQVWLDLEPQQASMLAQALTGGGSETDDGSLEFGMENAGDDGYWGVDNLSMFTVNTVPGDMNVNGVLDSGDVGAFALGLLDTGEYRNTYYGEFPVTRGSDDSTFDFDDIEWFVDVLDTGGVSTSTSAIMALLSPVPEPAGVALALAGLIALSTRRPRATRRPTNHP